MYEQQHLAYNKLYSESAQYSEKEISFKDIKKAIQYIANGYKDGAITKDLFNVFAEALMSLYLEKKIEDKLFSKTFNIKLSCNRNLLPKRSW